MIVSIKEVYDKKLHLHNGLLVQYFGQTIVEIRYDEGDTQYHVNTLINQPFLFEHETCDVYILVDPTKEESPAEQVDACLRSAQL